MIGERQRAISNLKNLPDEMRVYARKSSQGGVNWDMPEQENGGGCHASGKTPNPNFR